MKREMKKKKISSCPLFHLFLGKVELAQLFPQLPVLAEHVQGGRGLSQVDDVTGIAELVQDVVLHV